MCAFGNVLTDSLPPQLSLRDLSGAKTGCSLGTGACLHLERQ